MADPWYKRHAAKALNGMKFLDPYQYTVYNRLIDVLYDENGIYAFNPPHLASLNLISTSKFNKTFWSLVEIGKGGFVVFIADDMRIIADENEYRALSNKEKNKCSFVALTVFKHINGKFLSKKALKTRNLIFPELKKNNDLQPPRSKNLERKNKDSTTNARASRKPKDKAKPEPKADERAAEAESDSKKSAAEMKVIFDAVMEAAGDRFDPLRAATQTWVDVRRWVEADPPCDLEADILPAIASVNARTAPGKIRSLKYYEPKILETRDSRLQAVAQPSERKNHERNNPTGKPTEADHANARRLRRGNLLEGRKADRLAATVRDAGAGGESEAKGESDSGGPRQNGLLEQKRD